MNRINLTIILLHLRYLCYGQSAFNFSQFAEEGEPKNNLAITRFYEGKKKITLKLFKGVLVDRKTQGIITYICDAYLYLGQFYTELGENKKEAYISILH